MARSWFATSTKNGPFTAVLISSSRVAWIIITSYFSFLTYSNISTTTETNFFLPPSLEAMAKKREDLLLVATEVRQQYGSEMPQFLTKAQNQKKRGKNSQIRKRAWRRAFKKFWKWLELRRSNGRRRKLKHHGKGRGQISTSKMLQEQNAFAKGDWIGRNRRLLKQTLQKLETYTNIRSKWTAIKKIC